MSARRTGTTAVNKRGVKHPRQPTSVPQPSTVTQSALLAAQLADSPLGAWDMQETEGTVMVDQSGNGRNGTYTNITLGGGAISGQGARSASFLKTSPSKAVVANGSWMNVNDFTMEVLVTSATWTTGYKGVFSRYSVDIAGIWRLLIDPSAQSYGELLSGPGYGVTGGTALVGGSPYLLAIRCDSTAHTFRAFKNGSQWSTVGTTGTPAYGTTYDLSFGRGAVSEQYPITADMSHGAFYGTALSDARLLAHAQAAGLA